MAERFNRYRVFFFWDYEKEEDWLNRMSDDGYELDDVHFWKYTFRRGTSPHRYRLEFLEDIPGSEKGQAYLQFMQETGIELVATCMRWAYFRRPAGEGPFEIYSDLDSRIKYCKRLLWYVAPVAGLNLLLGGMNLVSNLINGGALEDIPVYILNILIAVGCGWGMRGTYREMRKLQKRKELEE